MRYDLLIQIGDRPDEPATFGLRCPNAACAGRTDFLVATPSHAELRCPSCGIGYTVAAACGDADRDGAELALILVRSELLDAEGGAG